MSGLLKVQVGWTSGLVAKGLRKVSLSIKVNFPNAPTGAPLIVRTQNRYCGFRSGFSIGRFSKESFRSREFGEYPSGQGQFSKDISSPTRAFGLTAARSSYWIGFRAPSSQERCELLRGARMMMHAIGIRIHPERRNPRVTDYVNLGVNTDTWESGYRYAPRIEEKDASRETRFQKERTTPSFTLKTLWVALIILMVWSEKVKKVIKANIRGMYIGKVSVGGVENPDDEGKIAFFIGCIQDVKIGTSQGTWLRPMVEVNVRDGCFSPNQCASNPCPSNSQCIDHWGNYSCKCFE
ncbi:uncharacterized protein NPIL_447201, partial [Nephila pilipes]